MCGSATTVSFSEKAGNTQGEKIHSRSAHLETSQQLACSPPHGGVSRPYQLWLPHVLL